METDEASRRVAAMVVRHGEALFRTARSVSLCVDDAQDAVQRGLEIYMRRLDAIDPKSELNYLKVIVRNEALAVRRSRAAVPVHDVEFDAQPNDARTPEEHASGKELVERTTEALGDLREDEARALLAKAAGLSYVEIAERFQWSYSMTNRNITRGRARFLTAFRGIESGERCESFAPAITALAGGTASSDDLLRLRPHLRRCAACRATVRQLHGRPRAPRIAAALLLPAKWLTAARAEAYAAAARASEAASAWPLGGGRGAAATALVGLCIGGGGLCAAAIERHDPPRVVAVSPDERARGRVASKRTRKPAVREPAGPVATPIARPRKRTNFVRVRVQRLDTSRTDSPAKSEEFGVQASGRSVAKATSFEPRPATDSPQIDNTADPEFSVAG